MSNTRQDALTKRKRVDYLICTLQTLCKARPQRTHWHSVSSTRHRSTLSMPGGAPLATCTLTVGMYYSLLTYYVGYYPAQELHTVTASSPPSPSGDGRGRLLIRGRSRREPPLHHRPTARRPPIRGRAVKRIGKSSPGWMVFPQPPELPLRKRGVRCVGRGGVRCHRVSSV